MTLKKKINSFKDSRVSNIRRELARAQREYIKKAADAGAKTHLDVGSNTGTTLRKVADPRSKKIVAIDISQKAIETAKRSNRGKILFQKGDARKIQFGNNSFDLVTSFEMLEHIADKKEAEKAMKEMHRITKKWIVISVPSEPMYTALNLPGRILASIEGQPRKRGPIKQLTEPEHAHHYTPNEMKSIISKYFDIVEYKPFVAGRHIIILAKKK